MEAHVMKSLMPILAVLVKVGAKAATHLNRNDDMGWTLAQIDAWINSALGNAFPQQLLDIKTLLDDAVTRLEKAITRLESTVRLVALDQAVLADYRPVQQRVTETTARLHPWLQDPTNRQKRKDFLEAYKCHDVEGALIWLEKRVAIGDCFGRLTDTVAAKCGKDWRQFQLWERDVYVLLFQACSAVLAFEWARSDGQLAPAAAENLDDLLTSPSGALTEKVGKLTKCVDGILEALEETRLRVKSHFLFTCVDATHKQPSSVATVATVDGICSVVTVDGLCSELTAKVTAYFEAPGTADRLPSNRDLAVRLRADYPQFEWSVIIVAPSSEEAEVRFSNCKTFNGSSWLQTISVETSDRPFTAIRKEGRIMSRGDRWGGLRFGELRGSFMRKRTLQPSVSLRFLIMWTETKNLAAGKCYRNSALFDELLRTVDATDGRIVAPNAMFFRDVAGLAVDSIRLRLQFCYEFFDTQWTYVDESGVEDAIGADEVTYPLRHKSPGRLMLLWPSDCILNIAESSTFYVALSDHIAKPDDGFLTVKAGNQLAVLNDRIESEWWFARLKGSRKIGKILSRSVRKLPRNDAETWYYGQISRSDAEQKLLHPSNLPGAFLVREVNRAESRRELCLSVRLAAEVKHHPIDQLDDGHYFLVDQTGPAAATLAEMIEQYRACGNDLSVHLKEPCTRTEIAAAAIDHWEIAGDSVKTQRKLFTGQVSEVSRGTWNKNTLVAIKTSRSGMSSPDALLPEAAIIKKLNHPNVVQLYGVCTLNQPAAIIMELILEGSLFDFLGTTLHKLQASELIIMAAQIASGMAYLENLNWAHLNLMARNILVAPVRVCKISDFGNSCPIRPGEEVTRSSVLKVPVRWSPPEAQHGRFSLKSDVWSFGVVLFELFTHGQPPYVDIPSANNGEVWKWIQAGNRLARPADCPVMLYELMLVCWNENAVRRPTFKSLYHQLRDHSTFLPTQTDRRTDKRMDGRTDG
ncbi:Tyrosine-protein kinase Src42A [Hypsibius exemplaris]|uniref:Tyrosine-protein kinase n=1 Tax=Hypsibius exemplaris TaxID=2072580 RepID=A0A1W0WMS4_HYPEX|nr:Tyrosine-protein kinase Src42A [Hypsibius exemplaris]